LAVTSALTVTVVEMQRHPAILLDLDGTLIDSAPGIHASCRAALQTLGHSPPPLLDMSGLIGPPIEEIMSTLLAQYGDDRVADGVAAYRSDYGERGLYGSSLYPGVADAMKDMRHAGAQLLVATSKRRRFAVRILEHLGLANLFEEIHGSEDGGTLDHKPELIAHVIARHGLVRESCVMVGDRRHDILGARASNIRSLGVLWGYGTREELECAGASALVAKPTELKTAALAQASGSFWRSF
jgi:phosphoglycolate phosphatase